MGSFVTVIASVATFALWLVGATGGQMVAFWLLLTLAGVALVFWLAHRYSPTGTEQYKVRQFATTECYRIDADRDVAFRKLDSFDRMVELVYGQTERTSITSRE